MTSPSQSPVHCQELVLVLVPLDDFTHLLLVQICLLDVLLERNDLIGVVADLEHLGSHHLHLRKVHNEASTYQALRTMTTITTQSVRLGISGHHLVILCHFCVGLLEGSSDLIEELQGLGLSS